MPSADLDLQSSLQAVADAYDRYADRIRDGGYRSVWSYIATKALSDWALLAGIDLKGKRILNIGCCEPIDELFLARHGMRRWVALDRSQKMLAAARDILDRELSASLASRIALCAADAGHLPFRDATFDLVVSFSALEHIPDPMARHQAFAQIARVTRPEGHVVITVPNRYSLFFFCHRRNMARGTAEYGYSYLYSPREFRATLLRVGLRPVRFQSELTGVVELPSYLPSWPRALLRRIGYFGERIGYLARRC
ncbi:MAG: class I SAM-dependent methyltransferase [Candidatus Rokubacteria bacterium]|nr:class I SAM-dependent methyltransferase [Candidatus Rokubacteria bacterium]